MPAVSPDAASGGTAKKKSPSLLQQIDSGVTGILNKMFPGLSTGSNEVANLIDGGGNGGLNLGGLTEAGEALGRIADVALVITQPGAWKRIIMVGGGLFIVGISLKAALSSQTPIQVVNQTAKTGAKVAGAAAIAA